MTKLILSLFVLNVISSGARADSVASVAAAPLAFAQMFISQADTLVLANQLGTIGTATVSTHEMLGGSNVEYKFDIVKCAADTTRACVKRAVLIIRDQMATDEFHVLNHNYQSQLIRN